MPDTAFIGFRFYGIVRHRQVWRVVWKHTRGKRPVVSRWRRPQDREFRDAEFKHKSHAQEYLRVIKDPNQERIILNDVQDD